MSHQSGTLLLFWDYDCQWGADRSRSRGGPKDWGPLEFENTDRLLEILAACAVKACFAVVGAAALQGSRPYHDPGQIRRISEAGHEVASHSFRHEWLPGLDKARLGETLKSSKDALEQCIGAPVTSFVPPYNQPFDYARRGSFSISERLHAGPGRTSLSGLCEALYNTDYRFCRVAYRPWSVRAAEIIAGRRLDRPRPLQQIEGIWCARINAPCGFAPETRSMLRACENSSQILTVYGHPHSLNLPGAQNLSLLQPFLAEVNQLRASHRINLSQPARLLAEYGTHESLRDFI